MDRMTLDALKGSIKKWEGILDGSEVDRGPSNCPLCKVFYGEPGCDGCPVSAATGTDCCRKTPYEAWCQQSKGAPISARRPGEKKAARAELEFLRSLLPVDAK